MKKLVSSKSLTVLVLIFLLSSCKSNSKTQISEDVSQKNEKSTIESDVKSEISIQPLNIENSFVPCGWMGDGELGKKYISFEPKCTENPHSGNTCIKISYSVGPKGWAGIYWLNSDCNWGDEAGYDLSSRGFSRITFWGRGENGGESSQFKAGGVKDKKYKDSFNYEPKLDVEFTNEWREYTIDLESKDLSNVIGGFCWVSNTGGTIYLDDLKYN